MLQFRRATTSGLKSSLQRSFLEEKLVKFPSTNFARECGRGLNPLIQTLRNGIWIWGELYETKLPGNSTIATLSNSLRKVRKIARVFLFVEAVDISCVRLGCPSCLAGCGDPRHSAISCLEHSYAKRTPPLFWPYQT